MTLDAAQLEQKQNEVPTDWTKYDQQLSDRGDENSNRFAMDQKLHVRFYSKPKYNPDKSAEENRPIYEDTVYVEIMMPGEKHNVLQRPAGSMRDDLRFPKQYAQFMAGLANQIVGTPLKVLPFLSEAQIEEFAYFKVRTVEQLAELSDNVGFMGAQEYKRKAKKFLDGISNGTKLAEENADLRARMAAMEAMLEKMTAPKAEVDPLS